MRELLDFTSGKHGVRAGSFTRLRDPGLAERLDFWEGWKVPTDAWSSGEVSLQSLVLQMISREVAAISADPDGDPDRRRLATLHMLVDTLAGWSLATGDEGVAGRFPRLDGEKADSIPESTLQEAGPAALNSAISARAQATLARIAAQGRALRDVEARRREALEMADSPLRPEAVNAFLRTANGLADFTVSAIRELPGGFSKQTLLLDGADGRRLVMRRDLPFGPSDTSAPDEAEILLALVEAGLPVPRPLGAGRHTGHGLGRPFLIVDWVAGTDAEVVAATGPQTGRTVALELAGFLGRLHALDPARLGLGTSAGDAASALRAHMAEWRQWWERNRIHDSPLIEAGFAWLGRNLPPDIGKVVAVHGDARPANMLVDAEGRLSAMLDWEYAHAGDASEDYVYAWQAVSHLVAADDFLASYRAGGGASISEAGRIFYNIWWSVRNLICLEVSWSGFVRGLYPSTRLGSPMLLFGDSLHQTLANALLDAVAD